VQDGDRQAVITALMEGIGSARNSIRPGELDFLEELNLFAEVALASLESAGFKVIRNA
jgi:hypothetical protein